MGTRAVPAMSSEIVLQSTNGIAKGVSNLRAENKGTNEESHVTWGCLAEKQKKEKKHS